MENRQPISIWGAIPGGGPVVLRSRVDPSCPDEDDIRPLLDKGKTVWAWVRSLDAVNLNQVRRQDGRLRCWERAG
jgi:hypothetical protein